MKIFALLLALSLLVKSQIITTIIPNNFGLFVPLGLIEDNQGFLYICDSFNNRVVQVNPNNLTSSTPIFLNGDFPTGVAFDNIGNFVVTQADEFTSASSIIFANFTSPFPITRTCDSAPINCFSIASGTLPNDIKNDRNLFLYFSSSGGQDIRRIDLSNLTVTVVAGRTGSNGFSGDGGLATDAQLSLPQGFALDKDLNIFIADKFNTRIRRVDAKTNIITTFAGNGNSGTTGDGGPAVNATFATLPNSVACDAFGNVFVAELFGIRKIDPNGIITSLNSNRSAGGFEGDGEDVSKAQFSGIQYLYFNPIGDLLVSDTDGDPGTNNRIRKIKFANVTCSQDSNCVFPCFTTTCNKAAGFCNFGTLSSLKDNGVGCETTGTCLAGQCIGGKAAATTGSTANSGNSLTVSMMLIVILAAIFHLM